MNYCNQWTPQTINQANLGKIQTIEMSTQSNGIIRFGVVNIVLEKREYEIKRKVLDSYVLSIVFEQTLKKR